MEHRRALAGILGFAGLFVSVAVSSQNVLATSSVRPPLSSGMASRQIASRTAAEMRPATVDYPRVDSLTVAKDLVYTAGDTLHINAFITNPSAYTFNNAAVTVTVYEPLSHYRMSLPAVTINLPAGTQTIAVVSWKPTANLGGLHYQLSAGLEMAMASAGQNLIVNGTFEGGCGGWTLLNDIPPALGTKCDWGYLHTYTTMYNTIDQHYAEAYQDVDVGGIDFDQYFIQFSALCMTNRGFYGDGLAETAVVFLDTAHNVLGSAIQRAYVYGVPGDTDKEHYSLVQQNVWLAYQQSIASVLSKLPGVSRSAVRYVRIMTLAMPVCSMPYCSPSADVYLDDVAITAGASLVAYSHGKVTVSNLTDEIVGDRTQMVRDCLKGASPCENDILGMVPAIGELSIFEKTRGYLCAAGVYRASGDDLRGTYAEVRAGLVWVDCLYGLAQSLVDPLSAFSPSWSDVGSYLHDQWECDMLHLRKAMTLEGTQTGQFANDLAAWRDVLAGQSERFRYYVVAEGLLLPSVMAGVCTTDMSYIHHRGVFMSDFPDSLTKLIAVADTLRCFADNLPLGRNDVGTVQLRTAGPGNVSLGILYQSSTGHDSILTYQPLACPAGALISFAFSGSETRFPVSVDWTADGIVDTTLYPTPVTEVPPGPDTPSASILSEISVYPNPFNPQLTISTTVARQCKLAVRVFDASGRLISTVFDGVTDAGRKRWQWGQDDARGSRVASGVYFVSIKTGREVANKKIVLVR